MEEYDGTQYKVRELSEDERKKHRERYGLDGAYDTDEQIVESLGIKPNGAVFKSKYDREIKKDVYIDVYDVLCCFNVTNPAIAHAVKKLLMPGNRGYKDMEQDLHEAIQAIYRGIEIEEGRLGLTHVI
ncbi:MAG: hypothetical protein WC464_00285 [Bdellovibrionales bacterium]